MNKLGIACTSLLAASLIGSFVGLTAVAQATPGAAPQIGDCTNSQTINSWTLAGPVVDCSSTHTGQVIYVGKWTAKVSPNAANRLEGKDQEKVAKELSGQFAACRTAMEQYLGSRQGSAVRASLFTTNGTGPDESEWASGARWFRCEIVAKEARSSWKKDSNRLLPIPSPDELRGYLSTLDFGDEYEFCIAREPQSGGYGRFSCDIPPIVGEGIAWTSPAGKYPGSTDAAYKQMRKQCISVMRQMGVNVAERFMWVLNFTPDLSKSNYKKSEWLCSVGIEFSAL